MKQLLVAVLMTLASVGVQAGTLSVEEGWVRLVPPVSANSAAYFVLHNSGKADVDLVAVESAVATAVEMHTVVEQNGLMSMQPLKKITVPADDCVFFKPGSHHIMLIGLKQPLQNNQKVPLTLRFDNGEFLQLDAIVKNEGDDEHAHHQH